MAVSLSLLAGAGWQFFDDNGNPLSGGLLYTYEAGTTTPLATYTDSNGNVANANPIVLDAAGRSANQIWLNPAYSYKFVLKTSLAITVWTEDNVPGYISSADVTFLQAGTGAVTRTVQSKLRDVVSVKDFGAVGDGVTDDTAAIQAAINAAYTNYNKTVFVPNGIYKLTGTLTITQGVMIMCEGSQGSNEAYGTVFKHYSNNSCFRWDGSGAQYTGTGGGLQNCLIVKADTYSGGNAIEVINQSDTNRCGEMVFHNVLAYGLSSGRWARGFVFDGTATNTPGARGVRTVHMTKCRAADVTTANETIVLNQVTHFYAHGLAADTGSGAAAGITIKGICDGIYLNALGCAGTFTIVTNDASNQTNNFFVDGKIGGVLTVNDSQVDGVMNLAANGGGIALKSKRLKLVSRDTPYFLATRISVDSNVTGDATSYTLAFDNEVVDTTNAFGTNTFTCVVAGTYEFSYGALFTGLTASHTRIEMGIIRTGSVAQNFAHVSNPYAQSASGQFSLERTVTLDLEYGDTVYVNGYVSGGTKVVNFYGTTGSSVYGFFSGKYIP